MTTVLRALVPAIGVIAVLLAPIPMEMSARNALAIATAMVLCWIVEILHPAIVGFIGCFLFRAAGGVEFDTAFAGFATVTPWFLYGALLLVGAADRSGLIGSIGVRTPRLLLGSVLAPSLMLVALAYVSALVVPSSLARATMLAMLAIAWARQMTGVVTTWLVLVATYSAAMFEHPEMAGGARAIVGWDVAASLALLVGVVLLARMPVVASGVDATPNDATSTASMDLRVAAPVAIAVGLWITTPLHGLSPALVGLGTGLVCCLPGIALMSGGKPLINPDPLAVIFAGTAMSIPAVLTETGAVEGLTHLWLTSNLWMGMLPQNLHAYWTTTVYRLLSPEGARPPLPALDAALGSTAIWAYAGSTLLALHQSPALIFGMSVGGCRSSHVLAVGLLIMAAGSLVVVVF